MVSGGGGLPRTVSPIALPYNAEQAELLTGRGLGTKYLAWNLAYDMIAAIEAYEGTRRIEFLDLFESAFNRSLALRDSVFGILDEVRGKIMNASGTNRYSKKKEWVAWDADAGMILFPAARYCRLVKESGLNGHYSERAEAYLKIIKEVTAEFDADWRDGDGGTGLHFDPYYGDVAPLNHMTILCAVLIIAARLRAWRCSFGNTFVLFQTVVWAGIIGLAASVSPSLPCGPRT